MVARFEVTLAGAGGGGPFSQELVESVRAGVAELAWRNGWRLVVLFGSLARGEQARDADLAILPDAPPSLLEQGHWQAEFEHLWSPLPVDLLVMVPERSPVIRYRVFRDGRCLFEREPRLFERERDRAFFLYADSAWLRRQQGEALIGHR